jgi:hypothetical protein
MDFSFYLQQGQHLLEKKDPKSVKKALEHFRTANQITEEDHVGKPKILYLLALGNLIIGNIEQAYKTAYKASLSIDLAIDSSPIRANNMRNMLGGEEIDALIKFIEKDYQTLIQSISLDAIETFDENELDFRNIKGDLNDEFENKSGIVPEFNIESLSDDVLFATFRGQSRLDDEMVYFDKLKGDVLAYVEGYLSSYIGDQSIANRRLSQRIINGEPKDFLDDERYIMIDRLRLIDFLSEYRNQASIKEPFITYCDFFKDEILKEFAQYEDIKLEDLTISTYIQEKFGEYFLTKFRDDAQKYVNEYKKHFDHAAKALALSWISRTVFKNNN